MLVYTTVSIWNYIILKYESDAFVVLFYTILVRIVARVRWASCFFSSTAIFLKIKSVV
jgi:hypothetical protein